MARKAKIRHAAPYTVEVWLPVCGAWCPMPAYWASVRDALLNAVRRGYGTAWRVCSGDVVLYTAY